VVVVVNEGMGSQLCSLTTPNLSYVLTTEN